MAQREIRVDDKTFNISYVLQYASVPPHGVQDSAKRKDSKNLMDFQDSKNLTDLQDSSALHKQGKDSRQDSWIVFLHGWGANKELMKNCFCATFAHYNHLYIDLPGFGNSSNEYILCTRDYAEIISEFLRTLGITQRIVAGHSFGGKIAALLAPEILVLLSSAGIPKDKSMQVKTKIILAKMCKKFGIKTSMFRTKDANGLSANMYETLKRVVDEDFSGIFGAFRGRAFIFWGKNDDITPPYMARKIHALIKDSSMYELDGGHFFFLEHAITIDRIVHGI